MTSSEPITRPVTVEYASLNPPGDQYAHSPDDFEAVAGTLTFVPGETAKTIPVIVNGDPDQEGNKVAVFEFTNPTNATLDGSGQGGVAILTEPTAVIDTPAEDARWSTGDEISFSGHIDDPVDGVLPDSALRWQLRLQHCPPPTSPGICHTHVLQEWNGVAAGGFVAPDHGYPAHLELELTAQGPSGLDHRTVRELHPNTVEITLDEQALSGDIVLVNDGSPNPTEGCNPLSGFPSGAIALIHRGTCPFTQKVHNAQNAGAAAVIVVNNEPGDAFEMGGTDPAITIPSVMVALDHGNTITVGLPATGSVARIIGDP